MKSKETFVCGREQDEAFPESKKLSYFNPQDKTCLIADTSLVALGAVIV